MGGVDIYETVNGSDARTVVASAFRHALGIPDKEPRAASTRRAGRRKRASRHKKQRRGARS